ncbi:glycerophosphodiester phosphodiesterase family protein [Kiloniella laminariae]|uniref:Glycerophosphodiester phosphodiesterase family protein n=1 Tax=Kiloniella laminariae TaxID=454162 RepID=A0ABT4LJH0_9PROT|nr:glycerophosphodiester phosphodiesterase family protein [Kiloniella laminariae]MCZ4281234.1 glycerophosphodiester phosphodiesterase family protein [Kiloniella laminariae]
MSRNSSLKTSLTTLFSSPAEDKPHILNLVEASVLSPTFARRFSSPKELSRYTRLSALKQPLIIAHRAGYSPAGIWPECALESADEVLRNGPALIEIDIRTSSDGELFCIHDKTLNNGTTGTGPVRETPAEVIHRLHLLDAKGVQTKCRVPSLDNFLVWSSRGALLWLDIKEASPKKVIAKIREHKAEARVIVSAYGRKNLLKFLKLAPDLVYFVPFVPELDLPDLESVLDSGAKPDQLIGFAGLYLPDIRASLALAEHNIPALLDLGRGDRRLAPDQLDPRLYKTAVQQGFPLLNTDHYQTVQKILSIKSWA